MISIFDKFYSDIDNILQETLIDKIFSEIEGKDIYSDEFMNQILKRLENEKISIENIEIDYEKYNDVHGTIHETINGDYIIRIRYPKKFIKDERTNKLYWLTLLHEYSHIITYKQLRDKLIPVRNRGKLDFTRFVKIYNYDMFGFDDNLTKENAKRFLDYVFTIPEFNNFAFSFAISFLLENTAKNTSFEELININDSIIKKYLANNDFNSIYKYRSESLNADLQTLLNVQLAIRYLNLKEYNSRFVKMIKKVLIYERRLKQYLHRR